MKPLLWTLLFSKVGAFALVSSRCRVSTALGQFEFQHTRWMPLNYAKNETVGTVVDRHVAESMFGGTEEDEEVMHESFGWFQASLEPDVVDAVVTEHEIRALEEGEPTFEDDEDENDVGLSSEKEAWYQAEIQRLQLALLAEQQARNDDQEAVKDLLAQKQDEARRRVRSAESEAQQTAERVSINYHQKLMKKEEEIQSLRNNLEHFRERCLLQEAQLDEVGVSRGSLRKLLATVVKVLAQRLIGASSNKARFQKPKDL